MNSNRDLQNPSQQESFAQGTALQRYNSELTRYIENIRTGRDDLHEEIVKDEEEKNTIETEIAQLTERLTVLTEALVKKYEAQEEFDRTIQETEQAFMKILESSQTLLHVLKKEDSTLNKRKNHVSTRRSAGGNAGNKENLFSAGQTNHSPEIKRTARGNSANNYILPQQKQQFSGQGFVLGNHQSNTIQQY